MKSVPHPPIDGTESGRSPADRSARPRIAERARWKAGPAGVAGEPARPAPQILTTHSGRSLLICPGRLHRRLNPNTVIYGVSDFLLAAQVTLGGLYGHVPEEELNLFELAASNVTEPGACPPQIVRRNLLNAGRFREVLNHVPNNLLRQAISPDGPALIDGSEQATSRDS